MLPLHHRTRRAHINHPCPLAQDAVSVQPCHPALRLLLSVPVRKWSQNQDRWLRPFMAGLMAALMVALTLVASFHGQHHDEDHDTESHHGQCAVCSIHQGKLDVPHVVVSIVTAPLSIAWTTPARNFSAKTDFDFSLSPNRGPPASASSL